VYVGVYQGCPGEVADRGERVCARWNVSTAATVFGSYRLHLLMILAYDLENS
jgi:hypothetical protein